MRMLFLGKSQSRSFLFHPFDFLYTIVLCREQQVSLTARPNIQESPYATNKKCLYSTTDCTCTSVERLRRSNNLFIFAA